MIEPQKQAYLEAMGFDIWVARPPEPRWDRLALGPGQGSTLLVCPSPQHTSSRLAGDIARILGGDPVWAWPDPEGSPEMPSLEQAVEDRLFTQVVVFGEKAAARVFGKRVPDHVVSSAVLVAADLDELATRGTAKQALWSFLRQNGPASNESAS